MLTKTVYSDQAVRLIRPDNTNAVTMSVSSLLRIIDSHRAELPNGRVVRLRDEFEALEQAAAYRFRDRGLLEHAMTHTSRANEDVSGGVFDNESLEFLGDAVLGFVIADILFREFAGFDEGQKSKTKASLVSWSFATTLAKSASALVASAGT